MAEIAAGFLGPVLEVMKWFGAPIIRQFNYLCCFTTNINNLEEEAKKLEDAAGGVQVQVDRALEEVRVIVPQVETWLAKSNDIKNQKTTILEQIPNVGSGCLKLRARFSLSKTAKKMTDRVKEIRNEGKFDVISLPGRPAAGEPIQLEKTYEFKSRKQIEEDIMAVLRGGDVSMIGICGMGGLGKTTMAKRIMNKLLQEHVFQETVIVVVSQQVNKIKIQHEIGGSLGLNLEAETSEAGMKRKLHTRLSDTKRILLVLDDVWQGIKLEEFGIPRDSKGCTILITSRNRDALSKMDVQKEFGMGILTEDEARFLFREKVGTCMDDDQLKSMAEGVVNECGRLPLALTIVGEVLKAEKKPSVWREALRQLRQRDPDIPGFVQEVYTPLKLSYDFLESERGKSLVLLCCLFPEDANIPLEFLTCFGMGLGIFKGSLEEVSDSVSTLIQMLKRRSLLLDSEKRDDHVRMHDVVRDVCIYIAKQKGYVDGNDCSWISSFDLVGELPTGLRSQNLRLLFLSRSFDQSYGKEAIKLDSTFFEGICDLHVLCIQKDVSLTSLPLTHSLKNLKSLVLDSCGGLKTISAIGEFVNLEILICRECRLIEELPLEMKRLNRLKLLDLTECENLERIGQGVISSLYGLEELKMLDSFKRWESKDGEERENAGVRELEALTNLRCLEIEIEDPALAAKIMHLSSRIKRFRIGIGASRPFGLKFDYDLYNKRLIWVIKEGTSLGNNIWMQQLLRETEYLELSGDGANSVDLAKRQNIRCLVLRECETLKNIRTTSMEDDATVVPASLELLILWNLPKLEGICDGPISSNSFHNLKELQLIDLKALKQLWKSSSPPLFTNLSSIYIRECNCLRNLGQLSIAGKDCLPQLQELCIWNCEMMEQVFLWNKEGEPKHHHCITEVFPKLMNVSLYKLPNLTTFYQETGGIEFPLQTELFIDYCPKLKSMRSDHHNSGGSSAGC